MAVVISQSVGWSHPELLYYLAIYIIYILAHSAFVMYSPHRLLASSLLPLSLSREKMGIYWQPKALELPPEQVDVDDDDGGLVLQDRCLLCDLLGCYYVKHNNQLSVWQAVCLALFENVDLSGLNSLSPRMTSAIFG